MLTFLFALAGIWTLFWLVVFIRGWGEHTSLIDNNALCATCAKASNSDSSSANPTAVGTNNANADHEDDSKIAKASTTNASGNVASTATPKPASTSTAAQSVTDKNDQKPSTPLFEKPEESDDLKIIKGIGVVMEKTLNDLGITTFKQLADFQQAEVKMVADVLSESNAGFGDRIERDEWVDQAKELVKKKAS